MALSSIMTGALLSANASRQIAHVQYATKKQMDGHAGVLDAEIKLDSGRGGDVTKKKEELEETQKKAADKKLEQKRADAQELEAASYKMELKGKDLEDLTNQFSRQLSLQAGVTAFGGFDVKA